MAQPWTAFPSGELSSGYFGTRRSAYVPIGALTAFTSSFLHYGGTVLLSGILHSDRVVRPRRSPSAGAVETRSRQGRHDRTHRTGAGPSRCHADGDVVRTRGHGPLGIRGPPRTDSRCSTNDIVQSQFRIPRNEPAAGTSCLEFRDGVHQRPARPLRRGTAHSAAR